MPEWTEPMKALCRGRCGDVGDPPCWKLPDLSSECDDVEPCQQCQADRIAALEAENARLRECLERIAEAQPSFDYVYTPPGTPFTDAKKVQPGSPYDRGKADTYASLASIARTALQENDNA